MLANLMADWGSESIHPPSFPLKEVSVHSAMVKICRSYSCYAHLYCQQKDSASAEEDREVLLLRMSLCPGLPYPPAFIFTSEKSVKWFLAHVDKENASFWTWLALHVCRVLEACSALQSLVIWRISVFLVVISTTQPSWQAQSSPGCNGPA